MNKASLVESQVQIRLPAKGLSNISDIIVNFLFWKYLI